MALLTVRDEEAAGSNPVTPTVEIPGQGQCPRTATLALSTFRGGSGEILEKILESVSTVTAFEGRI